jgi:hypothetical protein
MKRISIGHLASVFALFLAVASVGCIGQTISTGDGTDESTLTSQSDTDPNNGESSAGAFKGKSAQALELKVHPTDENGGPSPEPWEAQQGPSPEPWNGHAITIASPTGGSKP